jgi:hypothetical protein
MGHRPVSFLAVNSCSSRVSHRGASQSTGDSKHWQKLQFQPPTHPVILNHQHRDENERFKCMTAVAASATGSNKSSVHPSLGKEIICASRSVHRFCLRY